MAACGAHCHSIREFKLSHQGITVGPPLKGFSGIFTGTPVYKGEEAPLMSRDTNDRG
jgi:circadian clock protein KaiC